ncbi:hypothetical protein EH228_09280 [Erwinia endophytica]|uniref:hypothetical protein n=1 Tax=Erwinia endophytica TaxID=1563158 RepID=UPI001265D9D4|nr:hypothetical protein [Erwinia endophytica]KAB8311898.1 hypothetical protein EH228_09280 [Erwinia endophytica]
MRELNMTEVSSVSGAGIITDITSGSIINGIYSGIGSAIGGLADTALSSIFGTTTNFSDATATIGLGLSQVFFQGNLIKGASNIQSGISGIIDGVASLLS